MNFHRFELSREDDMRHKHSLNGLLALLALYVGSLGVEAADDVVQQIPNHALAYVVIKNMQRASGEVDQTAERMQLPAPNLLAMAKEHLHLVKGVVDAGDMALVLVAREAGSPVPVFFVRTDNYEELRNQLNPDEQEGPISQVVVGGATTLICKKGDYAVFAPATFRDGLKQIVESEERVEIDSQTRAFIERADAYAVATDTGVKVLSQQAVGVLQMVKQQFADSGPQGESAAAAFGIYEELFRWASKEVSQVVLRLEIDDNGAISLLKRVGLQNPVEFTARDAAANATKRLAHLPEWPYVMAFAGEFGDSKTMEKWMELSLDMMRATAGQLSDEQTDKLVEASRKSMEGLRGMSFVFGVPAPEGSIYSRMGMVMEVEDAGAFINNYVLAMKQMQQIFADSERVPYRILAAETGQVAGVQGMKAVMQLTPAAFGPGGEQAKEMLDKLYGEGGKIEVYAAPVDINHVALAYVSEESLRKVIQAAKSPNGLAADNGIQTAATLLSDDAQMVGFISPEGSLQFVQRMMAMFVPEGQQVEIPQLPPFPSSPPLGFSFQNDGEAFEAGLVAPVESLIALGKYIQAWRALRAE